MPNSRVRALTENASTPATPTIAIVSATSAKPPKTSAFSRSGASTSARTSSRVAALSTGCSADIWRMRRVIVGTSAYGSPVRVCTNPRPAERGIERHSRPRDDILVVDVRRHAHDPFRLTADAAELQDEPIGHNQPAVDGGINAREHPLRHTLAHDRDPIAAAPVVLIEIAAGNNRYAERCEESRRHGAATGARVFLTVRPGVPFD